MIANSPFLRVDSFQANRIMVQVPPDNWDEQLLNDSRIKARVAKARQSLRDGLGISVEEFRAKYEMNSVPKPVDETDHPQQQA
jgi:hypothetical protein